MRSGLRNLRRVHRVFQPQRPRSRPAVEKLEDRCLLAGGFTEFPLPTAGASPVGITNGPDGALWFTEPGTDANINQIGRITPAGTITEFGGLVRGSNPTGITTGPDGNLWFVESLAGQVGRITPAGVVTEFPVNANAGPNGITAGPDGALWFTESSLDQIGRITPAGAITAFSLPASSNSPAFPEQIALGPDNNLWFTEGGSDKIGRITPAGVVTEFALPTPMASPLGITAGPDGNLWFTEVTSSQIGRINPATGAITEFPIPTSGSGSGSGPSGITTAPDGALWFTEAFASQLGRITTAGAVTEQAVPTANSGPNGIAVGPDGNLWFTESTANKIGTLKLTVPGLSGSAKAACTFEGIPLNNVVVATFNDPASPLPQNYAATINWGDGTINSGVISATSNGFQVSGSHTYAIEGTYPLTVTVRRNGIPAFNAGVAPLTLTTTASVGGFVTSLYQTVLERSPDPAGLSFWLQQLRAGATHEQLANAFWVSPEHRGLEVDQFYATLLHRPADAGGRQAWVNALLAGASENDVVVDFLVSGEYTASHPDVPSYVTGLYADLLGRSPDAAGFAFWKQILQTGSRSRAAVAYYFLTSTESYVLAIDDYYRVFLGRKPSPAEEQNFLVALENGATPAEITSIFLGSGEFITREIAISCQMM